MKKQKKEVEASEGLVNFFDLLGKENSVYKRVVLEVFLEEILNGKDIRLSGEERQEGSEGGSDIKRSSKGESNKDGKP